MKTQTVCVFRLEENNRPSTWLFRRCSRLCQRSQGQVGVGGTLTPFKQLPDDGGSLSPGKLKLREGERGRKETTRQREAEREDAKSLESQPPECDFGPNGPA